MSERLGLSVRSSKAPSSIPSHGGFFLVDKKPTVKVHPPIPCACVKMQEICIYVIWEFLVYPLVYPMSERLGLSFWSSKVPSSIASNVGFFLGKKPATKAHPLYNGNITNGSEKLVS